MKIVVDIFGADNSPVEIVKGCIQSLCTTGHTLVLSGNKETIIHELDKYTYDKNRIEFLDCQDIITNDMEPLSAIRNYENSSLVKALDLLKNEDSVQGMISAGSTGAVLAGGTFRVGRIDGVKRMALGPCLPTMNDNKKVCLVDCGANTDSKAEYIAQFGMLGSCYMSAMYDIAKPVIGLVSNGTEDRKGNQETKIAFDILKNSGLNFAGNLEARDALSAKYDVVACDGFVGNVLLKSVEGTAKFVTTKLKETLMGGGLGTKIGALLVKKQIMSLRDKMNYHSFGGAPLLGLKKVLVKSHGSSDANAIAISIAQVKKMIDNNMIDKIKHSPFFDTKQVTGADKQIENKTLVEPTSINDSDNTNTNKDINENQNNIEE